MKRKWPIDPHLSLYGKVIYNGSRATIIQQPSFLKGELCGKDSLFLDIFGKQFDKESLHLPKLSLSMLFFVWLPCAVIADRAAMRCNFGKYGRFEMKIV